MPLTGESVTAMVTEVVRLRATELTPLTAIQDHGNVSELKQKAAPSSTRVAPGAATSKEEDLPLWIN